MKNLDRIASINRIYMEDAVHRGAASTKPLLDLDLELVEQYARGELDSISADLGRVFPPSVLEDIAGKEVLCLAGGGGQQSAIFGLLGAHVTVLDLAEGQLKSDRIAADHYGYDVKTLQGDMRDLSCFAAESFNLVYQSCSCWIPDLSVVYEEAVRVLRQNGLYRIDFTNPMCEFSDTPEAQAGKVPYAMKEMTYRVEGRPDGIQFRHHMDDIFNGLLAVGLTLQQVVEAPYWERSIETHAGGWFVVLARKGS